MTLKAFLTTAQHEALDEAAQAMYLKHGDGFRLDVSGVEFPDDVKGLKSALAKQTDEAKRLKILADAVDPTEFARLKEAEETRVTDKATAEGDFTTLKDQLLEVHAAELKVVNDKNAKLMGTVTTELLENRARTAITAAGGVPEVLLPHAMALLRLEEGDSGFSPQVIDENGVPQIADGAGTPMTLDQLVEVFKAHPQLKAGFNASGTKGSGTDGGGTGEGGDTLSRSTPGVFAANAEKIASGDVVLTE